MYHQILRTNVTINMLIRNGIYILSVTLFDHPAWVRACEARVFVSTRARVISLTSFVYSFSNLYFYEHAEVCGEGLRPQHRRTRWRGIRGWICGMCFSSVRLIPFIIALRIKKKWSNEPLHFHSKFPDRNILPLVWLYWSASYVKYENGLKEKYLSKSLLFFFVQSTGMRKFC